MATKTKTKATKTKTKATKNKSKRTKNKKGNNQQSHKQANIKRPKFIKESLSDKLQNALNDFQIQQKYDEESSDVQDKPQYNQPEDQHDRMSMEHKSEAEAHKGDQTKQRVPEYELAGSKSAKVTIRVKGNTDKLKEDDIYEILRKGGIDNFKVTKNKNAQSAYFDLFYDDQTLANQEEAKLQTVETLQNCENANDDQNYSELTK